MASSFRVQDHFHSYTDWENVWCKMWKRKHPHNWKDHMDQFMDLPFEVWQNNELIEEFYYHEELLSYKGKLS